MAVQVKKVQTDLEKRLEEPEPTTIAGAINRVGLEAVNRNRETLIEGARTLVDSALSKDNLKTIG